MTPTREQVTKLLIEAGYITSHSSNYTSELDAAVIAFEFARAQALDEAAAKVRAILKQCEDDDVNDPPLEFTASQIEALKAKP